MREFLGQLRIMNVVVANISGPNIKELSAIVVALRLQNLKLEGKEWAI